MENVCRNPRFDTIGPSSNHTSGARACLLKNGATSPCLQEAQEAEVGLSEPCKEQREIGELCKEQRKIGLGKVNRVRSKVKWEWL